MLKILGECIQRCAVAAIAATAVVAAGTGPAHGQTNANAQAAAEYIATHSDREDLQMVPMRDGVHLAATILFPKGLPRQGLPTILVHGPYNPNGYISWFATYFRSFLEHGYAIIIENSRGRYFSEGTFTFLTHSGEDGYDAIDWISKRPWSNGKVGAFGCSSSAEEQHRMNAMQHPALAASVPMGSGAGIGKVGPYNEMGTFYRGGAIQNKFFFWYYASGYKYKPSFPPGLSHEDMLRIAHRWTLEPDYTGTNATHPWGDLSGIKDSVVKAVDTLPLNKVMQSLNATPSDMDYLVERLPNDPRWKEFEFGGEGYRSGAPTLYINSWYDTTIGPNVALYEYETKNAANDVARNNMFMVVAPTLHCQMGTVETERTKVGERDMGDARFDYVGLVQRWFDHWVKGSDNGVTQEPKIRAYLMGVNQWRSYDSWPPRTRRVVYYLDSGGAANSREGNGRLTRVAAKAAEHDTLVYDPLNPVPTVGDQLFPPGPRDQAPIEIRNDVLVYTSPPLMETLDVTGSIEAKLYLSTDVKDTDLFLQLVDVYPDGKAYNIDQTVQRLRWREGYEKPVFMEKDRVYKVEFAPIVTSNAFGTGHRIRVEISSSSFPRFERNLNTGGNNYDEKDPKIAHNVIHHSATHPSQIILPIVVERK